MKNKREDYVTDTEYVDEFNPEQAPAHLALVAALRGFEPPDLARKFAYCELGCGKGRTSLILAASHPEAEFHAFDLNPAYIAHAQSQAKAAHLDNVAFQERRIEDLNGAGVGELPMFDVVAMHGVWSWVSPEVRKAILEFLQRRVKPGGLVYVTYNLMTQWAALLPMQHILKELAASMPGTSDAAVTQALAQVEQLTASKVISPSYLQAVKQLAVPDRAAAYLAHEFLPEHWSPTFHSDVARAFSSAKLTFAGSADLVRTLDNIYVNDIQRTAIGKIADPELRETLTDLCAGHWLRFDVFVRGARRISPSRQDKLLGALKLALVRPAPDFIDIPGQNGIVVRAHPDKYRRFTEALERRPHAVAELLALPIPAGQDAVSAAELVCVLVGTGLAYPYHDTNEQARAACDRLNRIIAFEGESAFLPHATMAVARLRAGLPIVASDFELYLALQRERAANPNALASSFVARCKANGRQPVVDGKLFGTEAEVHQALTSDYARKIERLAPLWTNLGLIETRA